jgi:hypothetical protein
LSFAAGTWSASPATCTIVCEGDAPAPRHVGIAVMPSLPTIPTSTNAPSFMVQSIESTTVVGK